MALLDDAVVEAAESAPVDPHDASDIGPPPNPMPPLDPDTLAGLRTSIERYGVLVPVVVDHEGAIIDGHHRLAIAEELGVKYPLAVILPIKGRIQVRHKPKNSAIYSETMQLIANLFSESDIRNVIEVPEDADVAEIARSLNLDRRHLTKEQRLALTGDLRAKGASIRAIATATGVSKSQAGKDIKQLSASGQLKPPTKVTGLDGKTRTAKPKQPRKPRAPKAKPPTELEVMAEQIRAHDARRLGNRGLTEHEALALVPLGQRVEWRGEVGEVTGHPKAAKGYVTVRLDGETEDRLAVVADLIPDEDPVANALRETAQRAAIEYIEHAGWHAFTKLALELSSLYNDTGMPL